MNLSLLVQLLIHPYELRSLIQYKIVRDPLHDIQENPETSGWDRERMRKCWGYLDLTSRSFAAVIKELEGELSRVVCIFYLVLRALDTVEDDMTLDLKLKVETLRTLHKRLDEPGWTFTQSGPNEKDRIVLVDFDAISGEYRDLPPKYQQPIKEACIRMGNGMAYYAEEAEKPDALFAVDTLSDFDLYCHYVAGIIGEGLSKLFSATGKESSELAERLQLSNSMGLHLQKTNVMRDFKEDLDDGRLFWPKAIWSKYVSHPKELCEPGNELKARHALVEMCFEAMQHSIDALDYLSLLHNQSVFNFCAIPQVMAIASIDECFGNLDVYKRNVKIRKGMAVNLIMRATNPRDVAEIFRKHARSIHQKVRPSDPDYLRVCVMAGRITQWVETRYPSWVFNIPGQQGKPVAPASREDAAAAGITDNRAKQLPSKAEVEARAPAKAAAAAAAAAERIEPINGQLPAKANEDKGADLKFLVIIAGLTTVAILSVIGITLGGLYLWTGGDIQKAFTSFDGHFAARQAVKEL